MSLFYTSVAILMACLCALTFGAPFEDDIVAVPTADAEDYRLPLTIWPVTYNISLKPYLLVSDGAKRFTFDGDVLIEIVPNQDTKTIIMHSKNLQFSLSEYWSKDNVVAKKNLVSTSTNLVTDKITFELTETLTKDKTYYLHFVYTGTMDDDMHGFYRSSYVDKNNNVKWIGSTQFQTNHARRAFPSFDEPKFKAIFNVNLTRHNSMNTFANTRLFRTTTNGDYRTDEYPPTPKMSTYILAFIVSEFTERATDNKQFGVIARPEYYDQSEYSFNVGQKILAEMDRFTGIPYYGMGNDKMHMAAIPDFSAGAMENWGLLTYRERSLLYEEGQTTLNAKQAIAAVITHEQAHMWFGDLVTCDWWSYTWLNEGFARYFQYFGTAKVETSLDMDKQFVVDQIQSVMSMDSTNSTNPLSDENTNSPADLSRMFNSISYNKGGTFIRMVRHVLGETDFQKAIQNYLNKYRYQNTVPQNLFDFWLANFPEQFKSYAMPLFTSYTEQVGYPVIFVDASLGDTVTFAQKRFLLKTNDGANKSLLYTVPITYTHDKVKDFSSTTPKFFLSASTNVHSEKLSVKADWFIANIQETGYYRVNYDEGNWHNLHHALLKSNWDGIHELNRAQIVDDLLNLARSSEITYELAMAVLEYLETETNYLPWTSAFNGYSYLTIRLGTEIGDFGKYITKLTEKTYKLLGFEEKTTDGTLDIYNRAKVLAWSCKYGNSDCITEAKKYFQDIKNKAVPVNIRSVVYCVAMREGNSNDFDTLFNMYKTATVATEETLILNNLGCVKDKALVEKYFYIIMGDDVRRQDKSSALSTLYTENSENISPVFKLVTENVDQLATSMGGYSAVATVISNIASRFTEESQQNDLKDFNTKNKSKFGNSAATLEAAEKTVAENLEWSRLKLGPFKTYLAEYVKGSAPKTSITSLSIVLFAIAALLLR